MVDYSLSGKKIAKKRLENTRKELSNLCLIIGWDNNQFSQFKGLLKEYQKSPLSPLDSMELTANEVEKNKYLRDLGKSTNPQAECDSGKRGLLILGNSYANEVKGGKASDIYGIKKENNPEYEEIKRTLEGFTRYWNLK